MTKPEFLGFLNRHRKAIKAEEYLNYKIDGVAYLDVRVILEKRRKHYTSYINKLEKYLVEQHKES